MRPDTDRTKVEHMPSMASLSLICPNCNKLYKAINLPIVSNSFHPVKCLNCGTQIGLFEISSPKEPSSSSPPPKALSSLLSPLTRALEYRQASQWQLARQSLPAYASTAPTRGSSHCKSYID